MREETINFSDNAKKQIAVSHMLTDVFQTLKDKGYDPINQIIGYLLTEDPAYIPRQNGARQKIRQIDRDVIMEVVLKDYLKQNGIDC